MERIEKATLNILVTSLIVVFVVITFYMLEKYLESPPLFIEPKDNKLRTSINMVLEAENIEGLKKVCSVWAAQEDRSALALKHFIEELERTRSNSFWFLLAVSLVFTFSSGYLYYQVKRFKRENSDEL